MEVGLLVFSAVSAISTVALVVFVIQIQKGLNTNFKKQIRSYESLGKQFEDMLHENQVIQQRLVELTQTHNKSIEKLYELLRGSGDIQVEELQAVAKKLEDLKNSLEESVRF